MGCSAYRCTEPTRHTFCDHHWMALPHEHQAAICAAYQPRRRLQRVAYRRALFRAVRWIGR